MRFFQVVLSGAALITAALALEFNSVPTNVQPGQTYTITYSPKTGTPTIILRKGDPTDLATIQTLGTGSNGEFKWTVPSTLPNAKDYALEIQEGSESNFSGQLTLTGSTATATASASASSSASSSASASKSSSASSTSSEATTTTKASSSASASVSSSAGTNSTISSATLSRTSSSSPSSTASTTGGSPPNQTGAASLLGSSPAALILGAVAAIAYL